MPLNGTWRAGRSGRVAEDRDPYSNELLVSVALANERDLDEAFAAATAAQPRWKEMLPGEKAAIVSAPPS
jgi:aldehyde dehydrogenase (NAD+)